MRKILFFLLALLFLVPLSSASSFVYDYYNVWVPNWVKDWYWVQEKCIFNGTESKTVCDNAHSEYRIVQNGTVAVKRYTEKLGVIAEGKIYYGDNLYYDRDQKILFNWTIPIGDRNFNEYGYCLLHEIKKGVCKTIQIK